MLSNVPFCHPNPPQFCDTCDTVDGMISSKDPCPAVPSIEATEENNLHQAEFSEIRHPSPFIHVLPNWGCLHLA